MSLREANARTRLANFTPEIKRQKFRVSNRSKKKKKKCFVGCAISRHRVFFQKHCKILTVTILFAFAMWFLTDVRSIRVIFSSIYLENSRAHKIRGVKLFAATFRKIPTLIMNSLAVLEEFDRVSDRFDPTVFAYFYSIVLWNRARLSHVLFTKVSLMYFHRCLCCRTSSLPEEILGEFSINRFRQQFRISLNTYFDEKEKIARAYISI